MTLNEITAFVQLAVWLIGIPIAIIQVYILSKQIKNSVKQFTAQTLWNKKHATFEYLDKYSKGLKETNKELIQDLKILHTYKDEQLKNQIENLLKNNEFRVQIFNIALYFEDLAIGIRNDYFDEVICKESLSLMAIATYDSLVPYFNFRKIELGQEICQNFQWLVSKWNRETGVLTDFDIF
jgi:hypothetical protein